MHNFIGKDGFFWWMGVVEKRDDPLNLGRVRVRIFGLHTENKELIPTDELPWAQPMVPINTSLNNAAPQEGDFAFGFFMDGASSQAPCIMGVFPGIPKEYPKASEGFSDARTDEELQNSPRKVKYVGSKIVDDEPKRNPININEPTTSRLYRNENIDKTFVQYKKDNRDLGVLTAGGGSWDEPETKYNTTPPLNSVMESESGHIMEFDDTPGSERVQIAHRMGSFVEFFPDGSKVTKVAAKNYEIYMDDNNIHVMGTCNITVDGNANIYVKGSAVENVDGNYTLDVTGDVVINGRTINLNHGTMGAARVGDTADTGDQGTGSHFDVNSAGTNIIESGSSTVFIGD